MALHTASTAEESSHAKNITEDATPVSANSEQHTASSQDSNSRARSRIFNRQGMDPFWGGFGLQCGHFSVKMYAKMKELGPIVRACAGMPPP